MDVNDVVPTHILFSSVSWPSKKEFVFDIPYCSTNFYYNQIRFFFLDYFKYVVFITSVT